MLLFKKRHSKAGSIRSTALWLYAMRQVFTCMQTGTSLVIYELESNQPGPFQRYAPTKTRPQAR